MNWTTVFLENPWRSSRAHLRRMTKVEAKRQFEAYVLPNVIKQYGRNDRVAIREAWNNWTDALNKDGRITDKQVNSWDNPY